MSLPVIMPLPGWTENITLIVFVLAFGRLLIPKITRLLQNLLNSLNIEPEVGKNFIGLVTSLFWLFILGTALSHTPVLFSPDVFPVREVGYLILTFTSYAFELILPIVVLYVAIKFKTK